MPIRTEAIFITILLGFSLALTTYSYRQVKLQETPDIVIFDELSAGAPYLVLLSGANCAASFKSELKLDSGYEVNAKGPVLLKFLGRNILVDINFNSYFNPLGQLISSNLILDLKQAKIFIKVAGINPLSVVMQTESLTHNFSRAFSLPGPVQIRKRQEKYQIKKSISKW